MEALSTPVSSLRSAAAAHPRDPSLRPQQPNHHHHHHNLFITKPKFTPPPSSSLSRQPHYKPIHLSPPPLPINKPTSRAPVHRKASTGYAAALLDAARCNGALAVVERDVRRLAKVFRAVMASPLVNEEKKGEVVRGAAESGGFDRRVVALVRMLVGKQKVGMVGEVMEEFGRIWDEMSGTRTVTVSSERRIGEAELAGVAREVQRASGAARVKVRHVFRQSEAMFAI